MLEKNDAVRSITPGNEVVTIHYFSQNGRPGQTVVACDVIQWGEK